jgi:hypothetical protein
MEWEKAEVIIWEILVLGNNRFSLEIYLLYRGGKTSRRQHACQKACSNLLKFIA